MIDVPMADPIPPIPPQIFQPIWTYLGVADTDFVRCVIEPTGVTVKLLRRNENGQAFLIGGEVATETLRCDIKWAHT